MGLDASVCDELGKKGNHKCPSILLKYRRSLTSRPEDAVFVSVFTALLVMNMCCMNVRLSLMVISVFSAVHLSLSQTPQRHSLCLTLNYDPTAAAQSGVIKCMTLHTIRF